MSCRRTSEVIRIVSCETPAMADCYARDCNWSIPPIKGSLNRLQMLLSFASVGLHHD
jgi:hypothetical protein